MEGDISANSSEAKVMEDAAATNSAQLNEIEEKQNIKLFPPAAVAGLLRDLSELTQVEKELKDLTGKQNEMIEKIGEHNRMLQSNPQLEELKELMETMKSGLEKLSLVRQEMASIHERSEKLKERAERLSGLRRTAERREEELLAVAQLDVDVGGDDEQDSPVVVAAVAEGTSTSSRSKP